MRILVVNSGSSSLKFQFFDMEQESSLASGKVERIGMKGAILSYKRADGKKIKQVKEILDHTTAIDVALKTLMDKESGVIKELSEIDAVGHRVVHGGEELTHSVLIDDKILETIKDCIELAPLHNPHNIKGIQATQRLLPGVPQIAVFDTAFHHTIPDYAYMYALPYILYERYKIRRYGFHGTSHRYVAYRVARILKKPVDEINIISIHLGNGSSICAVQRGKSIDTSMGFTPVEGLVMGTRSGDIDPAIVPFIMAQEELAISQINTLLNKHSGLWGLSGISSDDREIEEAYENGNDRARLAIEVAAYRIKKYIGAYSASMGGVDVIVFTAGIGENSPRMRRLALRDMEYLGIKIDEEKNESIIKGKEGEISTPYSKVKVFVIPTNEELVIARDTANIVSFLR